MPSFIGEVAEREECVIEWTVRDFFSIPYEVQELRLSPFFSFDGARWSLVMYPNGLKKANTEGYITVGLYRQSPGPPIELNFSLGLKTSQNKIAEERHVTGNFDEKEHSYIWPQFLRRSKLAERQSELTPSGHLTWVCRMKHPPSTDAASAIPTSKCTHCKDTVDAGNLPSHERKCVDKPIKCPECSDIVALKHWYTHECQPAKSKDDIPTAKCAHCKESVGAGSLPSHERKCLDKPIQCPECSDVVVLKDWYAHECETTKVEGKSSGPVVKSKILKDLNQLLQNQENCDVVLRVKGREFPAHKAILTARSTVFASAFRNDMKEKVTGVVDIEDCEPSTFSDFLRFLYCEDVEGLSNETVFSLFFAADKYDVSDLRGKCLEFMKENLSADTFCDTLTLALRHSETELVRLATDFFVENADKIILTVAWQTFTVENPIQSNELFIKFVASVKH